MKSFCVADLLQSRGLLLLSASFRRRLFAGNLQLSTLPPKPNCVSKIEKLLVANRGEIACRIMRTAKRMGIRTVAVYSEPDAAAQHVAMADEAYLIGPAASQQSYLNQEKILHVAKTAAVQAIHPGYGFLSENAEFAELCAANEIVFIGPPASAIRSMGLKSLSKRIMEAANVPIIQGYHGDDQSAEKLKSEANRIRFPVMLKAVRGGGGKGMRIAKTVQDFEAQLSSARHEAMKSFGNDDMIVEKYVENPRHVEVQVFGDMHRNYVYLHERDCSVQRRHQKIIEEAPAPHLTQETCRSIGTAAVQAAAAVDYVGAGTVEFIMDKNDQSQFFFMEMNTRLQVEHPVTEMITGTDLVQWQILVAQGERLPLSQDQIARNGHSFEARIYAEDPENDFMPAAGPLLYLRPPATAGDASVRVETGVVQSDEVSVHYDPMIAKLVVWAPSRDAALKRLLRALSEFHIVGVETNLKFLHRLASHAEFMRGNVYTNFIPDFHADLFTSKAQALALPPQDCLAQLAAGYVLRESAISPKSTSDPFSLADGFQVNLPVEHRLRLKYATNALDVFLRKTSSGGEDSSFEFSSNSGEKTGLKFSLLSAEANCDFECVEFSYTFGDRKTATAKLVSINNGAELHLFAADGAKYVFAVPEPKWSKEVASAGAAIVDGAVVAPMPGVIEKLLVQDNASVKQNDPLVVMIAMKMEYIVRAPFNATVEKVFCKLGANVTKNSVLLKLHPTTD